MQEGDTAELECVVHSYLKHNSVYTSHLTDNMLFAVRPLIAYTYPFINVQEGDTAELECVVHSYLKHNSVYVSHLTDNMLFAVRPLIAYTYPFIKVQEGDTAELECVVLLGKPAPSIMWMKNRRVIRGGGRIRELAPGRIAVTNITHADDGEYICVASNIGGNATYSINVDVLGGRSGFCFISVTK